MFKSIKRLFFMLTVASLFVTTIGCATGSQWQPLFDGKTLNGWRVIGVEAWRAEDGCIVGEMPKDSPYTFLATIQKFGDFELKAQMKFDSNQGNSGIFFRSNFPPQPETVNKETLNALFKKTFRNKDASFPQVEFAPPGQYTGALYDVRGGWINKDSITDEMQHALRHKQWNDLYMKVVGQHVYTRLNNVPISDVTIMHPIPPQGSIALQLHSNTAIKVRFKNICIRPIPQ